MLQLLTTDTFAAWFAALDDGMAEDVSAAVELIGAAGPEKAPEGSSESLLWYEHPSFVDRAGLGVPGLHLVRVLDGWGAFRDDAKRILDRLESARFMARVAELPPARAAIVLAAIKEIRRLVDPRGRWTARLWGARTGAGGAPEDLRAALKKTYFEALEAAGFELEDVPSHSLALRELCRREPGPAFRLLYGVDVARGTALIVLGEPLDRSFYGDSVRRAERMWKQFLEGTLDATEPAPLR